MWKKTEIAAQRERWMQTCIRLTPAATEWIDTVLCLAADGNVFCNFSEWGPRGRLFKPNGGPQLGGSTVPHESEKTDKFAVFAELLWSNLTTILSAQFIRFLFYVVFCHSTNRGFGHTVNGGIVTLGLEYVLITRKSFAFTWCFLIDRISKPSDLYFQHYIFHTPVKW